jgi:RimJ/RimL family protein N-acetyltransferase
VRELRWGDFDDIVRAYWRLYDERDAGEPHGITLFARKPTLAEEVNWFASEYRKVLSGDAVAVVAELGGRVVGQCTVARVGRAPDAENGHVGELGIMVERGYRGRGVGHALLKAALARSRGRFEVVRLGVHSDNVGARRLYESFGFRLVGAIPRANRRRGTYTDEQLMALVLDRRAHPTTKR